ncbi:Neurotransmitter-gated ion-channel ligand binding domain protein, partial [Ancylostoma duodenale]
MFLQQILDVDEKNQLVSLNAWLSYTWQDYSLVWDPEKYEGIQDIRFPGSADHIWRPDILLYNRFPFDDQICYLKFGSWTFHGYALDLQIDADSTNSSHSMDLSTYVVNGEWTIISSPAVREVSYYKCCPEPYPTV